MVMKWRRVNVEDANNFNLLMRHLIAIEKKSLVKLNLLMHNITSIFMVF